MMTKDGVYQICKLHDHWGRGSCATALPFFRIVKKHYFLKIIFFTPGHRSDKLSLSNNDNGTAYQLKL